MAFHLLNTGPEGFPLAIVKQHSYNYELAAMYVMVLGFFTVYGAGPWSVDEQVAARSSSTRAFSLVAHRRRSERRGSRDCM